MRPSLLNGRCIFAVGLVALAVLGFVYQDFIIGRPLAWPYINNLNPGLSYVSNAIVILVSIAIFAKQRGKTAAFVIAGLILLLSLSRHLTNSMQDWLNTYKTLAFIGGSVIVAASFEADRKAQNLLIWVGSVCLAIFFIASGYAHFKFADFVTGFIPAYIPFHVFFTYFTAVSLLAGGIGILIPAVRKWAALLSGVMLAGWFLLLHIPRFWADPSDMSDRMGLCESFTFAGIFFLLAAISEKSNTTFSR
ncbi:MAG: hypothetical protein ABIN80_22860 [Dyadobacter sp.]|uniref:DoxX family protein n=1 Tax=Dyadobacter sp. TaxID=1914288 RepID=UPI003263BF23